MRAKVILSFVLGLGLVMASGGQAMALDESAAWGTLSSPNRGNLENELAGLAVVGSSDIWAVGRYNAGRPPTVTGRNTLALHWDGSTWSIVKTPNPTWPGADYFTLEDADGVSSTQVWAVGYAEDFASLKSTTLVERWDGAAWTIVPSPNPGGSTLPNTLSAVDAVSATDAWAVGAAGYPERSLVLRWNGARWRPVKNGCGAPLLGVTAVSSTDVWAVGTDTTCLFDGTSWSVIPSPQPRPQYGEIAYVLEDVSGTGPDDLWASGERVIQDGESYDYRSILEHWNGTAWTLTTDVDGDVLNGVEALSPSDVWAVGTDAIRGVVVHFDGTSWNLVPSPTPGDSGSLTDVEAESADHLWAAGTALNKTLIEESPSRSQGTVEGDTHVSGATVSWIGQQDGSTETALDGSYAIAGLAAGSYQLIATYPGCSPGTATVTVTAGTIVHQDLHLSC